MSNIKYTAFYKQHNTESVSRLSKPKVRLPEAIELPLDACIHYLPDGNEKIGIDRSHCLMRNMPDRVQGYHQEKLKVVQGRVKQNTRYNTKRAIKQYHKYHLQIKHARELDRAKDNVKIPLIVNYGMLPELYTYTPNKNQVYHEWRNLRTTMWDVIANIGPIRTHWIRIQLPKILPARTALETIATGWTSTSISTFSDDEALDMLELWEILLPDVSTAGSDLSREIQDRTNIVFVESGQMIIIKLRDLIDWGAETADISRLFYNMLETMFSTRSAVNTTEVAKLTVSMGDPDTIGNSTLTRLISEAAEVGELSGAEQRGLLKLSERYKKIPNPHGGEGTLADMTVSASDLTLKDEPIINDSIINHEESAKYGRMREFDALYINNVFHNDVMMMILAVQNAGVIIKDVKVKRNHNAVTISDTYSVQLQPITGEGSTVKFTLPTIDADSGTYTINGVVYRNDRQVGSLPIGKTKGYTVALTSYYGKQFIIRNQNNATNWGNWIVKTLATSEVVTDLKYGITNVKGVQLPRAYTAIAEVVSSFRVGTNTFFWSYKTIDDEFTADEIGRISKLDMVICGRTKGGLIGMDPYGGVYTLVGKDRKLLGTIAEIVNPEGSEGPMEYAEVSIYSKRLPIILALSYLNGLDKTLEILNIPYTTLPPGSRFVSNGHDYRLKFKDISYVLDIRNPEHRLLVGGFNTIRKVSVRHSVGSFNKRNPYSALLSNMGITTQHLRELVLMNDMFIDPITLALLKEHKEPTTFEGLLLKSNRLLMDDFVPVNEPIRYKGYERLAGLVYSEFIKSIRGLRGQGRLSTAKLNMNPNSVLLTLLQDQSIAIVEQSNPIHNIREKDVITHVGAGGRSALSMNKGSRAFTDADVGILSESSPDSGKVGIRAYLTANPNIADLRGTTTPTKPGDTGVKFLSTSAMVSPNSVNDDAKRINFIGILQSSGVACDGYHPMPYRTGLEQVVATRVDAIFATTARDECVVESVTDKAITVKYKDGKTQTMELGLIHGKAPNGTLPHHLVTDAVKGTKLRRNDVVTYNSGYFERDIIDPTMVIMKNSLSLPVAMLDSSSTIEDGCTISKRAGGLLHTNTTYVRPIVLPFDTVIHNLVKVGDVVDPDSVLCTLESSITADTTGEDATAIAALRNIAANNPKSKNYGTVSRIEMLYFGKIEDMSPSLQKVVSSNNAARAKVNKMTGNPVRTGEINDIILVNGVKITKGNMVIRVYIDGKIGMGTGDKLVFGNALKSTISTVEPDSMTTESGRVVDATFGYESISARIVLSPEIIGMMNTLLPEISKELVKTYRG